LNHHEDQDQLPLAIDDCSLEEWIYCQWISV
jgi:hypothetical protein